MRNKRECDHQLLFGSQLPGVVTLENNFCRHLPLQCRCDSCKSDVLAAVSSTRQPVVNAPAEAKEGDVQLKRCQELLDSFALLFEALELASGWAEPLDPGLLPRHRGHSEGDPHA